MRPPRLGARVGWLAWVVYAAVLVALIWVQPGRRMLSAIYLDIARDWWGGQRDLYGPGIAGFLYLPQSAIAFTPFTWFPEEVGQALWRLAGLVLLATGMRRVARRVGPRDGEVFAWSTVLSLSAAWAAARTGQSNLHLIACMLHAGVDLHDRRYGRSTAWLWLAMAMKPIAIVPLLLVGALHGPMRGRLAIGLLVFAALPFVHPDPAYVLRQLELGVEKVLRSSQPGDKPYADLVGLLRALGADPAPLARTAVQAGAALGTLALAWLAVRRRGPREGPLWLVALASCYLVLFNPRTETNSYVILVPHVALAAALALRQGGRPLAFALLVLACAGLGCDNYGRAFHHATSPWLKPLLALAFLALLAWHLARPRTGGVTEAGTTAPA